MLSTPGATLVTNFHYKIPILSLHSLLFNKEEIKGTQDGMSGTPIQQCKSWGFHREHSFFDTTQEYLEGTKFLKIKF